ncbi:MAG: tetratricopeptide repeat protein [Methanosarcina barkeri]|nr:tetratricopeptide repeat protein [Methanosarcina sp. ERenArc_MAG2]
MPLAEMHKRFEECTSEEKSILKTIKKLYICGVYEESQIFQLDQIRRVSANEGVKKEKFELEELIKKLCEKEFTKIEKTNIDRVWAEEAYIEDIVELNHSELPVFEEILSIFAETPEALFKIGNRAYEIGSVKLQKASYMKIAIEAYKNALKVTNMEQFPLYVMTLNNIGEAYRKLAEVEDKEHNCKKALEAFQDALKIITMEQFPIQYVLKNNIGNVYGMLAEVEDKEHNCKKALEAFQDALKIITMEQSLQYAITQINIGIVYRKMAVVKDKELNCRRATKEFKNALKIITVEQFPLQYALIQNNIGNVYGMLAEVEDKVEDKEHNCKKAVKAYQNALKILTEDRYPVHNKNVADNLENLINFCKINNIKL